MATKKEISMTGFDIVAYAGDAETDLLDALDAAHKGEFDHARELVKSAEESINLAHNTQTKLLSAEAGGQEMDVTFIMVHAQDTLMTTMMLKNEAKYFIDEYERIHDLEQKLADHTRN